MARLPQPGGDAGQWGEILNDFLAQSHKEDGSLKNDTVGAPQLMPSSVTSAALANGSITNAKIADGAVGASQISDGAVDEDHLASDLRGKINSSLADGAVSEAKLDTALRSKVNAGLLDGAVTTSKLANGAVGTAQLADSSVSRAKLSDVGTAYGIASLGGDSRLPEAQVPSRLAEEQISATISEVATPLVTAVGAGVFDPLRPSRPLLGFSVALAQRDTAPCDIVFLGDSIWEGHSASALAKRAISRAVAAMRTRLGITSGGAGYIPARYGATDRATADNWTTTGRTSDNSYGFGKRSRTLLLDGGTSLGDGTMSRTITCTSFKLLVRAHATQATSLFVSVDGGADQVWNIPAATTSVTAEWNSGALTDAAHTVQVKARSNSAAYFEGIMVFRGDETSGIRQWDGSLSGTRADQFNAETSLGDAWADVFGHLTPDLVVMEWMTNDATSRTSAQYETSMRAVVALVRSKAPNVPILLTGMYERGDTALIEPWANYVAKLKKIASDTAYVGFLDLSARIPKLNGADTYSLLSDGIHPKDNLHAMIGDLLAGFLLPQ